MDSWSLKNLRHDLSVFLELVEKYQIGDFSSLYTFQGKIESIDSFDYSIKNVQFFINKRIAGTIPENLNKHKITMDNTLSVNQEDSKIKDRVSGNYLFELNIDSFTNRENEEGEQFKSCWHLDKHINSSTPKYTHPIYHFHHGGEYLEGLDTGELSIFSSPRLPHPPMDIFLGFHFIISNFYSAKEYSFVNELKENFDYQQIIKRAQERLWTPYFKAFDATNTHQDFTVNRIFPLYVD